MEITYLLGAGASYNALPIVNQIPEVLKQFSHDFNLDDLRHPNGEELLNNIAGKVLKSVKKDEKEKTKLSFISFHDDILWLVSETKSHSSIDTFAKKLYLREDFKKLNKLKFILSTFFIYLEMKKLDKRYDSFFASILDDINNYPKNLKILSWNYDSQIEKAHYNFAEKDGSYSNDSLNLQYRGDIKESQYSVEGFCVHKLNGTTQLKDSQYMEEIYNVNGKNEIALGFNILREYENLLSGIKKPNMTFAWENFDANLPFFRNLKESISRTEILIVIGYSFPFFNRKIDKFILDSMPNLEKIYVQDPKFSIEIIEKIKGLIPKRISKRFIAQEGSFIKNMMEFEEKKFVDQFFIPIEF